LEVDVVRLSAERPRVAGGRFYLFGGEGDKRLIAFILYGVVVKSPVSALAFCIVY
jgi:hypothetical protein